MPVASAIAAISAVSATGPAAAQAIVQIALDEVRAIANGDVSLGATSAGAAESKLTGAAIPAGSFGEDDLAAEIAGQSAAVREVFLSTIQGVKSDLEALQVALNECAQSHEDTDAGAQQSLLQVAQRMDGYEYSSQANYDAARQQAGTALPQQADVDAAAAADPVQSSPEPSTGGGAGRPNAYA